MDRQIRNQRILNSDKSAADLAAELECSRSTVYRIRQRETFKESPEQPTDERSLLYSQTALSGVHRTGGQVQEEFQQELQDDAGTELFTEMAMHPVAAAVLFAISMAQRQVTWFWEPASESEADKRAAEFAEEAQGDMSQTWDDVISQVFTMLEYGFSACELVYKRRLGQEPEQYIEDPARSKFNDGLTGWRRWQFMSPRTLAIGNRWGFDDNGRVLSLTQQPPPDYADRTIPIEKMLLFRTVTRWDNPEGLSILRAMYRPWYYATNLEEVEVISAERMGAGFPIVYLGQGTSKGGTGTDLAAFKDIVRNIRVDEQSGLVVPYQKMGSDGVGALVEFLSPPSRGAVDFDKAITRYEQRMAMTVLAQFIFLGMSKVGTQALASTTVDVFQLSISAWSSAVASVINRFAVPRLFALNPFKLDALPVLRHSDISIPNLTEIAGFVNALVGATVLTPDEQLEAHLRELGGLPEKPEEIVEIVEQPVVSEEELEEEEPDDELPPEEVASESFFTETYAAKTIRGALARDEGTGKFTRGSGAPLTPEEKQSVSLGEGLVSGKMTTDQARQFIKLGLATRKAGGEVALTAQGRELARTLKSKPQQGVKTLTALLAKTGPKKHRPVKVGGAGGKKKGKGKGKPKGGKAKKPKGGGGGGKGEKEETEKEVPARNKEAQDRLVDEGGMDEETAQSFLLTYDSENPGIAANELDDETKKALADLGLLEVDEDGKATVTDDGKRLMRALKRKDFDVIGDVLGENSSDLFSDPTDYEQFVQRTRQGGPKWERATNAYELELRREYAAWADETADSLADAENDAEFNDRLDQATEALIALLIVLGRRRLPGAHSLGLAGVPTTPGGMQELADAMRSNEEFLQNSLSPDVVAKVRRRVTEDPLIRTDRDSLVAVLGTFLARIGSYAGGFWSLIMLGFGDRVRQDPDNPRVRWVRDSRARHCETCLQFGSDTGKVYDSFDDLLTQTGGVLPSLGTICDGNCRCHLEEEVKPGIWARM